MLIHLGNANALEKKLLPTGEAVFDPVPGEQITTFRIDEEQHSRSDAVAIVIKALPQLMNPMARPWWIECDDPMVRDLLLDHYGLSSKHGQRPLEWGDGSTTSKGLDDNAN